GPQLRVHVKADALVKGVQQIHGAHDVGDPSQGDRCRPACPERDNGYYREHCRQEVAVSGRTREGGRQGGSHYCRDQKDHTHVAEGMQEEQGDQSIWQRKQGKARSHEPRREEGIEEKAPEELDPEYLQGIHTVSFPLPSCYTFNLTRKAPAEAPRQ